MVIMIFFGSYILIKQGDAKVPSGLKKDQIETHPLCFTFHPSLDRSDVTLAVAYRNAKKGKKNIVVLYDCPSGRNANEAVFIHRERVPGAGSRGGLVARGRLGPRRASEPPRKAAPPRACVPNSRLMVRYIPGLFRRTPAGPRNI